MPDPIKQIQDRNGYLWLWDGERIYMLAAELEFFAHGEDVKQNGYYAQTWGDALALLLEYGYIEGE